MKTDHRTILTVEHVHAAAHRIADRWRDLSGQLVDNIVGVPRGGLFPAAYIAGTLDLPLFDVPTDKSLVVDDLIDSGATARRYLEAGTVYFDACYRKPNAPEDIAPNAVPAAGWLVFPWETGTDDESGPADAVTRLLQYIGEDPTRPGLIDTPGRVLRALLEMTSGGGEDPAAILTRTFDEKCDEMVVVRNVDFVSMCEHHLLPFTGTADVGYVPGDKVVGLSKLARLVDCFARRLQVQERMTSQIAAALELYLKPRGVGVVVRARHACMGCRGVRKPGAEMVTSALSGFMKDDDKARAEFLALARNGGH